MSVYNILARHMIAPVYDSLRGTHTLRCLRELEQSQWWPWERIHELQSQRLQQLITHAYACVPHYRNVMNEKGISPGDIRSATDLFALPVLTRQFVQQHREELVADGIARDRLLLTKTSGSTGIPLEFYSTREDQLDHGYARSIRALQWTGIQLGDRTAAVGRPRSHTAGRGHVLRSIARGMQRTTPVYVDSLSDVNLPEVVRLLASAGLVGIRAYPNAIALIAAFIKDTGSPVPAVKTVVTGGAELLTHERSIVREVFGTEPHSNYSSYEAYEIACECSAHEGLHISAEDVLVEVVDDSDAPVPPGVEGRILITNLHNYGMPFIRYDIGDSGSMLAGACSCGRTLPRLGSLVGRKNRFLVTRSGSRIFSGTLFLDRLSSLGMRQYQIVQDSVDTVVMRLVADPSASSVDERSALERKVLDMFQSKFGPELALRVEFVDRIEPTEAGKHVFMLSRVPQN